MSSASLILTDGGLALSEPKAVGAQGSAKVLAASSLGSCLVSVSGAVVLLTTSVFNAPEEPIATRSGLDMRTAG